MKKSYSDTNIKKKNESTNTNDKEIEKYNITVATNDNLEQMTIMSLGGLRMSARGLQEEIDRVNKSMETFLR